VRILNVPEQLTAEADDVKSAILKASTLSFLTFEPLIAFM
jgi:hypothetical protein